MKEESRGAEKTGEILEDCRDYESRPTDRLVSQHARQNAHEQHLEVLMDACGINGHLS